MNTIALFYNRQLLDQAGVQPPSTWDELRQAAQELTGDGVHGFAYSAIASYEGAWQFLPFMWSNGGDEEDLAGAPIAEAADYLASFVRDGLTSRAIVNWDQSDVMDQFKAGSAAMVVNGPWQIPGLHEDTPDLDWDVVTIPVPSAGDASIAPLGGEVWTIPATADEEKQARAAELLQHFVSPGNQLELGNARQTIPTDTGAAETFAQENPDLSTFVEQAETARARTARLGGAWPRTAKAIYTANQQILVDDMDPYEAFSEAARTVR